ncbi:MAG: NADH-quinone oxidoreductase subunit J, partial [Candidatus Poribacteria bacterium]|nr:NADH-quinone oxidoreductase subunit J [Candidatus Poribacteria bacterium]
MTQILFWVFAAVAIASALMVILHRNPVYSALSLVLTLFAVSGLYLLMGAYFVGAVQIVVYAGAIVVLFLFVIMLLNLGNQESLQETFSLRSFFGVIVGLAFVVIAGMTVTAPIGVGEIGSG